MIENGSLDEAGISTMFSEGCVLFMYTDYDPKIIVNVFRRAKGEFNVAKVKILKFRSCSNKSEKIQGKHLFHINSDNTNNSTVNIMMKGVVDRMSSENYSDTVYCTTWAEVKQKRTTRGGILLKSGLHHVVRSDNFVTMSTKANEK